MGLGDTSNRTSPQLVLFPPFSSDGTTARHRPIVQLQGGWNHSLALDGSLLCCSSCSRSSSLVLFSCSSVLVLITKSRGRSGVVLGFLSIRPAWYSRRCSGAIPTTVGSEWGRGSRSTTERGTPFKLGICSPQYSKKAYGFH